jgi:Ser/Thr protein kinase RdoA (MazF antagonist)
VQHPSESLPALGIPEASQIVKEPVYAVAPIGQGIRSRVYRVETEDGLVRIVRLTPKGSGRVEREAWVRSRFRKHPALPLLAELVVTDVPLAQSADVVVMSELPGTTMFAAARTMFEPEVRVLYEQFGAGLGALHATAVEGFGLLDASGKGTSKTWREAFDAIAKASLDEARISSLGDLVDAAESEIERLRPLLDEIPEARLLHGDAQPMNVQVHRGSIVAWLDFEFASGGDPDYELAYVAPLFEPGVTQANVSEADLAARREAFERGYARYRPLAPVPDDRARLYRLVHALRGTEFLSVVGPRLAAPARAESYAKARATVQRFLAPGERRG